ncbi:MAG: hypothetical protein HY738_01125 [Bacteroidia bacterium]|nr:hypothetical protein [Bacteroidia bacterium]
MKKRLLIFVLTVLFAGMFFSCEDCKECRQVSKNPDGSIYSDTDTPEEYCGEELTAKENEEPATVGDLTNEWVCE